jgi:hypothetical protein
MRPETIGALVNGVIPLLGCIYCTLIGYRIIGKRAGESFEYDQWHERFSSMFKIGGPLLIAFGGFLMAQGLAGAK